MQAVSLVAILLLSIAPYFLQLGLYNDDWAFISAFRDLPKYADWTDPHVQIVRLFYIRPLHGLWTWLLYLCFGTHPLPYHIINMVVLAGSLVAGFKLLRSFAATRPYAFPIAAVYCLLPELSTAKVWYAAYCVTLSQLFFLLGANATLRWIDTGRRRWKVAMLACWVGSILTYELFIPLIAAFASYALWKRVLQPPLPRPERLRRALPEVFDFGLVFVSLGFKALLTDRIEGAGPRQIIRIFFQRGYEPFWNYGLNAKSALVVNFWETARKPLGSVGRVFEQPDAGIRLACALAIAGLVYLMSFRAIARRPHDGRRLIALGFALFWLGYGIFFLTLQTGLSPAGTVNRTAAAAAFGVAFIAVAAVIGLARVLPASLARHAAALALGLMCCALALRASEVDHYWAEASHRQKAFLDQAQADLGPLPSGSTVMIEGLCQYAGPASVFETWWDTSGALKLHMGKDIVADMVSSDMTIGATGVDTIIYGRPRHYPYGRSLFVYQARLHRVVRLEGLPDANRLLGPALTARPVNSCPLSRPGHGVPI